MIMEAPDKTTLRDELCNKGIHYVNTYLYHNLPIYTQVGELAQTREAFRTVCQQVADCYSHDTLEPSDKERCIQSSRRFSTQQCFIDEYKGDRHNPARV